MVDSVLSQSTGGKKTIDLILKFVWLEMSVFSLLEVTVLYS